MVASRLRFLREFITQPQSVGAVAPSSPGLAEAMMNGHNLSSADVVVELGPGTGAFTDHLLERIGQETRLVAIEKNEPFAEMLNRRFPTADIVHGSALDVSAILATRGLEKADHIFSGLPWTSFPTTLQSSALKAAYGALKPGGSFVTFAYTGAAWLPRGRAFRRLLGRTFTEVETSPVVWMNLPPAFCYHCIK